MSEPVIEQVYRDLLTAKTDMQSHLPKLRELATQRRVLEFGTRRAVSTVALLAGCPISLGCFDMIREPDVDNIELWAKEIGTLFAFVVGDLYELGPDDFKPADFIFVDWMHNYDAAKHSLVIADGIGAKAVAFHDTEIFGRTGDLAGTRGLLDAVDEFLAANPVWRITHQSREDYGLTVIERP